MMKKRNVTKKIALVAMAALMALGMAACGKKDKDDSDKASVSSSTTVSQEKQNNGSSVSNEEKSSAEDDGHDWPFMGESFGKKYVVETYKKCEDLSDWGNYADFQLAGTTMYIKYPVLIPTGDNRIAYQGDGTVVMVVPMSGSISDSISGLESILQVAIDNPDSPRSPIFMMVSHFGVHTDGFVDMAIDSSTTETVGQYECCKYTGTAKYKIDTEFNPDEHSVQFVAYATYAKCNNAPFYWLVFDETKDQTMGSALADYAKKMGYTIVEDSE